MHIPGLHCPSTLIVAIVIFWIVGNCDHDSRFRLKVAGRKWNVRCWNQVGKELDWFPNETNALAVKAANLEIEFSKIHNHH